MKFWNREYKRGGRRGRQPGACFTLSTEPSEDLCKFTRWLEREYGRQYFHPHAVIVDLGCGNGRNLIHFARDYGLRGVGYDLSRQAIVQAVEASKGLPIEYHTRSITNPLPLANSSVTIALDMMTSHFLNKPEREALLAEVLRVLRPDGWLFCKTFLRDEDHHAERLLRQHPAEEPGTYIHPRIGQAEHVFTEEELITSLAPHFTIHKISKSHNLQKRRSISVYAQKNS